MFLYCGPLVALAAAFIASQYGADRLVDGYNCCSQQRRCLALAATKQAAPNDIVSLLPKNPTALQKEKIQLLKSALSLNNKKLEVMLRKKPRLLSVSKNGMERRLQYLQERLFLNKMQLSKMVQLSPSLIDGTDDLIESKLQYLQKRLMLEEKELHKFVRTQPSVLSHSIENMERKLVFIQSRLLLDDKELPRLVKKFLR